MKTLVFTPTDEQWDNIFALNEAGDTDGALAAMGDIVGKLDRLNGKYVDIVGVSDE